MGWRIGIWRALAAVCMAGVFQMAASVLSARLFSLPAADEDLQFARQQLYEQELEAIRREARAFRHDYKNILAGLSAQAGAGELDALLTSLADLDAGFDRRVGEKIRMSTQIGNLRIPQVRGLPPGGYLSRGAVGDVLASSSLTAGCGMSVLLDADGKPVVTPVN